MVDGLGELGPEGMHPSGPSWPSNPPAGGDLGEGKDPPSCSVLASQIG